MPENTFDDLPPWLRSAGELGVGAAILSVRRFNIWRREGSERLGPLGDSIDQLFENLDDIVVPLSDRLGEVLGVVAERAPAPIDGYADVGRTVATELGPQLLRLSGLTARSSQHP